MKRTISVVGSGSVAVAPDSAQLDCGVQVTGVNAQDALRRSNAAIQSILEALQQQGVDVADLRTRGPNLYPSDAGYSGSNDVNVVIRDIAKVGAVIDAVAEAGGPNLTMHGLSFTVSDPNVHLPAARVAAFESARSIAGELAAAAGAELGEVVTINESSGYGSPVAAARAQSAMKSTPVEAGTSEIRIDVGVTFRLVERAT